MKTPKTSKPRKTAPVDGTQILGDFGYPWPLVAAWSTHDNQWVTAFLNAQKMRDETTDLWFESDHQEMSQLRRWTTLPLLHDPRSATGLSGKL